MGRIGTFLAGLRGDELLQRDELAHALMYLTRGQPVVYYGDEQGFTGDGGDKDARAGHVRQPGRRLQRRRPDRHRRHHGRRQLRHRPPALPHHPRPGRGCAQRYPALADGAQLHRYASNEAGVYAFSRIDADERREYVVALNNATSREDRDRRHLMRPRARFTQVWPASKASLRTDAEGRRRRHGAAAVGGRCCAPSARSPSVEEAPAIHFGQPSAGGIVGGRAPRSPSGVPDGGFNQVTLAWRPVGADDWTPLGTDDNAPYRVFHDVSAMPKGTLLEYRAVLRDSSGNLSVASTYATVGEPEATDPPVAAAAAVR